MRLAQLETAFQKQAHALSKLQTPLQTVTIGSEQTQRLSNDVKRLEMQLAELWSQVQAEVKSRHLLSKLSGIYTNVLQ